jgi:hypothetical protein
MREKTASASIAKIFLGYLLEFNWKTDLNELINTYPLIPYAAENWMGYAFIGGSGTMAATGLAMEFFSQQMTFYNCHKKHRPANPWHLKNADILPQALYYASFGGLIDCVRLMLDKGADVNAEGEFITMRSRLLHAMDTRRSSRYCWTEVQT